MKMKLETNLGTKIELNDSDVVYEVELIEYERGWGSRLDDTLYFLNEDDAKRYVSLYNLRHNSNSSVPDWYMSPQYTGRRVAVKDMRNNEIIVNLDTFEKGE